MTLAALGRPRVVSPKSRRALEPRRLTGSGHGDTCSTVGIEFIARAPSALGPVATDLCLWPHGAEADHDQDADDGALADVAEPHQIVAAAVVVVVSGRRLNADRGSAADPQHAVKEEERCS